MFDKKTDVNIRLHLCPAITKKVFRSGGNQTQRTFGNYRCNQKCYVTKVWTPSGMQIERRRLAPKRSAWMRNAH